MTDSFYMYVSSSNAHNNNKASAVNFVPFYSPPLTEGEWKIAALHGKISKTWNTILNASCKVERRTADGEIITVELNINNQRLEKVSEMTAKLREELSTKLKDIGEEPDAWVKFGGSGGASRKIVLQPGIKIGFSNSLQNLLGLPYPKYDNMVGQIVRNIDIRLDYLNIKDYNILYMMCKDTQGVYANNKVMGILTDITADSNLVGVGDSIEFTNKNVVYHRWTGGQKAKIEVYFANSNGDIPQMNEGYSYVLLHFIKIL